VPRTQLAFGSYWGGAHIDNVWTECRCQFGSEEAFLSDQFTIANTFYALIVRRFPTYGIKLAGEVMVYVDALWNSPDMQVWLDDTNVGHWNINNFKV
jgi:glutathione S-transferase